MGLGSSLAAGITGNIQPALLIVDVYTGEPEAIETSQNNLEKKTGSMARAAKKVAAATSKVMAAGIPQLAQTTDTQRFYFYVQYNPSEMSVNGEKPTIVVPDLEKRTAEAQVAIQTEAATSMLEFKLYFDEVTVGAAFLDKGMNSLGALNPINTAKNLAGAFGKAKTVKKYVDGLIACVGNNRVKQISFFWASFVFIGKLSRITADYTMFDTNGNPIRAEVSMVMQQLETIDDWSHSIDKSFEKASAINAVGNLLNLNL